MDKMRMQSLDTTAQNIDKIGALFPNCITETIDENGVHKKGINFEVLKQMLSADVLEGSEAYEFTWVGKKAAIVEANKPIRKTLRPCKEDSENWDTTENLYIEGDNLEVLKLLQESYLGAIKMIYIDPPYNTGNDFIYRSSYCRGIHDRNILPSHERLWSFHRLDRRAYYGGDPIVLQRRDIWKHAFPFPDTYSIRLQCSGDSCGELFLSGSVRGKASDHCVFIQ